MPGSSSTNAPNCATRGTRPGRTWPTVYTSGTLDQGSAENCFNPSEIFCFSSSTRRTLTVISSPALTISAGSDTRDHAISDTWSSPWTPAPRSTNAPNSRTEVTRPVMTAPGTILSRTLPAFARCDLHSRAGVLHFGDIHSRLTLATNVD